jgi:hypothetical protein
MRYVFLLLLLSLSGCTLVPVADAGPCSAIAHARGCQWNPYVIREEPYPPTASANQADSSQKAGTPR